ncbi:hypothetical protein N7537_002560 [Penicillium hordei]|uniref:Uncharacterized protein n=1 Tax=Penicillium hordei TaxID=40994 RepID=A0AAD6H729_9EURO|nr:uncharacterized protein N7537_002560 [Penicillium hordei]KAJ5617446.1 hypothetical protein N7537_002560 [Penicillium hordei]
MFRSHLNERGIQGFVPFTTLNTQWVWMKKQRDPVYVNISTVFEADGEWKEIITKIKSAAKTLRFELSEKMEDDANTSCQSSLGPDNERNTTSNGPAPPILPHSLSTPETDPIVLICPTRDHVFNGRSRDNQSADQAIDLCIDQNIGQQNDIHNDTPTGLHGSTMPVVTTHGKLCLWCGHEGTTYETEDIQELQSEDYNHESGYEDQSHGNQHNDRQDDPIMREYTQGFKQSMRELDGEVPYSGEELFDSESEHLITRQESPSKVRPFFDPRLSLPSDLEQGLLDFEDNPNWCADRRSPADLADFGTPSISMEDRSGALDDDRISTQNSLSNFRFPHNRPAHDDGFGGQRVLQYEWSSNDEMRVETLRQMSVEALRQVENQSTTHFAHQEEMDVLMYDGNTWNQV